MSSNPGNTSNVDDAFFERADAHIKLSNDQLKETGSRGKVSASMLFSTARFNAWVSASGFNSAEEMAKGRDDAIQYFSEQYRLMLEENLNDYINNFDTYMQPQK